MGYNEGTSGTLLRCSTFYKMCMKWNICMQKIGIDYPFEIYGEIGQITYQDNMDPVAECFG